MHKPYATVCFIHLGHYHDDLMIICQQLKRRNIATILLHLNDAHQFNFSRVDLISLRHCRGYHLQADFIAKLQLLNQQNIPIINPFKLAKVAIDKALYLRDLENEGIPLIPSLWLTKNQSISIENILETTQWQELVIKPTISSKSWQTYRLSCLKGKFCLRDSHGHIINENINHLLSKMLKSQSLCIQTFMPEILTYGEISCIFIGGKFSHAIKKPLILRAG